MSYQFIRCQTHSRCPDAIGWYLILEPSDIDALMKIHKGVANLYYFKFGMDPHIKPNSEEGILYNPIRLAASWLQTVEKLLCEGPICVNSNGGCLPLAAVKILSTIEKDELQWPDYYDDEVITISRWPKGQHYYLSSNRNRVFVPAKYTSYEAAHEVAEYYTEHIQSKNC